MKNWLLFAALPAIIMVASCSHPDRDFKMSLIQKSTDKYIDAQELSILDAQLTKALSKSKKGISFGVDVIKDHDSMVNYIQEKKGCQIEGMKVSRSVSLEDFYVLLENSVSMQGYIGKGNPDFAEPIIALLQCGAQNNHTAYAGAKGDTDPTVIFNNVPQEKFLENISQGRFTSSVASPIDKMIEAAVDMIITEPAKDAGTIDDIVVNGVFCLITDGLLSGTNSEIARDREFTKKSLPVLENRIRNAVDKANRYGLHCLVYRLEAPFDGTYFDYKNIRHSLKGPRPYFMLIIGDKENLEKIEDKLAKETNFTKHPSKRFASYDVSTNKTITKAIIAQLPGQSAIVASGNTIRYNPVKLNPDPLLFTAKMQMKTLPAYYLDTESLRKGLSLTYYDKPSDTHVTIPVDSWLVDIRADDDTQTYVFTLNIENEYLKKMTAEKTDLRLSLPGHQDEWYMDLSTPDDSQIYAGDTMTFGLDRFMGGVMKGFGYQDLATIPDAICIDLKLVKTNK